MLRKEVCEKCRHVNVDNWTICAECGAPARPAVKCSNRKGPNNLEMKINGQDVAHFLHCLHLAVVYNRPREDETADFFWRRHARLRNKLNLLTNRIIDSAENIPKEQIDVTERTRSGITETD